MNVNLELKPLQWSNSQACLYCNDEWVLVYSFTGDESCGNIEATFELANCPKLCDKYRIKSRHTSFFNNTFSTEQELKDACEAHYREFMLKAFLQAI